MNVFLRMRTNQAFEVGPGSELRGCLWRAKIRLLDQILGIGRVTRGVAGQIVEGVGVGESLAA